MLSGSASYAQVVADEMLAAWNYEVNPQATYLSDFCVGSIKPLSAGYQGIKAIENSQNQAQVRHRFTLGKEVYQSIDQAKVSVAEINNPSQRTSKQAKMCDLRQAFNLDQVVYFVHTDVGNLYLEISDMLNKLHQYVE